MGGPGPGSAQQPAATKCQSRALAQMGHAAAKPPKEPPLPTEPHVVPPPPTWSYCRSHTGLNS